MLLGMRIMCATQKFAWYNLVVVGVALASALLLVPVLGQGALGCFGLLGFLGLGPLFLRRKPGVVVVDERDRLIQRRSWIVAYALFWVVFVLAAVVLSAAVYGFDGAVPVQVVQSSVFVGFMFLYLTASIAILVQYAGGSSDAE